MKKRTDKSSRKRLWLAVIVTSIVTLSIATGIILWSIGKAQEENEKAIKKDHVVMIVTSRGGMCSDGPCSHPSYSLYDDGSFEGHDSLTKSEVESIKRIATKANFSKMSVPAEDRRCDSYADGQDTILIFPNIYGDRQFVPCEMQSGKGSVLGHTDLDYILSLITQEDRTYNFNGWSN